MATNELEINKTDEAVTIFDSSKENDAVISDRYLSKLFWYIALWFLLLLAFVWIIDPYGVSPFQIHLPGINTNKPLRLDIDRLIKPYEVWRYQPKTVFLGTSRIQQSIDPSLFDGTDFAPAYNAAIPASTLAENAAHIEQYLKLDPNIKDIFIELFLYNFTTKQSEPAPKTWKEFFSNYLSLQLSTDAIIDSIKTISSSHGDGPTPAHIAKLGYRVPSSDYDPASTFSDTLYTRTVLGWDRAAKLHLEPSAMEALDRIVALARRHGVKLHMLLTPNYPWDDYRLMSLGYWPLLEEWMRKMASYSDVVSFSQYNKFLEEPPTQTPKMKWWNDPTHFSLNMGKAMMNTYLGHPDKDTPANLMRPLNPDTVESVIAERRAGALRWAAAHPDFVMDFEEAKTISDTVSGTLNASDMTLTVNGRKHPIVLGVGSVSIADKQGGFLSASGWAADETARRRVSQLVATIGSSVIAQGFPTVKRPDINLALGKNTVSSGFNIQIPLESGKESEPIRVFALMQDGRAVQLTSEISLIDGAPLRSLGRVKADKLVINNRAYPIAKGTAGLIEGIIPTPYGYSVNGWAADVKAHRPVVAIIAAIGSEIVAKSLPSITRDDITAVPKTIPSGFLINVPLRADQVNNHEQMRLYALMADGVVSPLVPNTKG
ncbi:hypothetical protein [Aquicella lusitana]|uniref:Uncharacterized protein n=1 Tax=Aquicella lusitana TaxID=254246 RepID=A0A370GWR3_9COXI|nr:hypothetical protein [Aquicella lusitana]RDI48128.1 hypothetical protein C8D86_10393 [Aquicella lusitana]VVC72856.1 hypothetical protein AQULUS_05800 [Aquicella lusitana]